MTDDDGTTFEVCGCEAERTLRCRVAALEIARAEAVRLGGMLATGLLPRSDAAVTTLREVRRLLAYQDYCSLSARNAALAVVDAALGEVPRGSSVASACADAGYAQCPLCLGWHGGKHGDLCVFCVNATGRGE